MSDVEDNDGPQDSPAVDHDGNDADGISDKDSDILSEIDDDEFADYNPETAVIAPVAIDEDIAKTLQAKKRKRVDPASKKPKEGRRPKKRRTDGEDDDVSAADGNIIEGKRRRPGPAGGSERKSKKKATPEPDNEENLSPEEKRQREIERAMDAAIKGPTKKRRTKKDEVDLEEEADEQIADLKVKMEQAAQDDNKARDENRAAINKVKLLPEVVAMLNRNSIQHAILDPETNFLQAVKFFLEPLNDGSIPAYNIQREIFTALTRLPIEKEALLSSGIGKIVLFYTRTKRAQPEIKRMAERLMGEWSRPILKRTDDFKKRHVESRDFDYAALKQSQASSQSNVVHRPAPMSKLVAAQARATAKRNEALASVVTNPNRAVPVGLPASYVVAPRSTFDPNAASGPDHRPVGASGLEAFRKMTQKGKKRN